MNTKVLHIIGLVVIIAAVQGVYVNSYSGVWTFDDRPNILNNRYIRADTPAKIFNARNPDGNVRRYVGFVSFAANYYFHKYRECGYHLSNVLIHTASAIFIYFILFLILTLKAFRSVPMRVVWGFSLITALLWACSPVQTESVTYIVQRFTSLSGMFYLGAFFFYIKGRRLFAGGRKRCGRICIYAAFPFFLCALFTKGNTIMLPLVIASFELLIFRNPYFKGKQEELDDEKREPIPGRYIGMTIGLMLICVVIFIIVCPEVVDVFVNLMHRYERREFTLYERVLTQFRVVTRYISLILFPHPSRLNLDYNYPISTGMLSPPWTLAAAAFIAGLLCTALALVKREPLISFALLWFFINNVVESTIIPLEIIFEHRMYLPSAGIIFIVVLLLFRFAEPNIGKMDTGIT